MIVLIYTREGLKLAKCINEKFGVTKMTILIICVDFQIFNVEKWVLFKGTYHIFSRGGQKIFQVGEAGGQKYTICLKNILY